MLQTIKKHLQQNSSTYEVDYSLPEWDLLGLEMLIAGAVGLLLSVVLYCIVFYI